MPIGVRGRARPVDHHRDARGLEPAAEDLGLELGPLAELDERVVAVVVVCVATACRCGASWSRARPGSRRIACSRRGIGPQDGHHTVGRSAIGPESTERLAGTLVVRCPSAFTSRRSAARRTPSTPTRSSPHCSPTGSRPRPTAEDADLVVVNTCAFIDAARQESIDVALALADVKRPGAKLVLTGCMAERYGDELAAALPEADAVVGFAGEGDLARRRAEDASRRACAISWSSRGPRRRRRGRT